MPALELSILIALGLVAGVLGGLLGIGGSIVMIPVLTLVLGKNQHLSQASAMIVNILVALPAVLRHQRADAVRWDVVLRMLPFGIVLIAVGVEMSNRFDGSILERVFGVFLLYVVVMNVQRLTTHGGKDHTKDEEHRTWAACGVVGAVTGFAAGLLGIGGGIICVPLLQRFMKLPLRECIAASAAMMCVTSLVGAYRKNATLESLVDGAGEPLGLALSESLTIAACLAPTAVIGGLIGAGLTHSLPLRWVRLVLIVLLCLGAVKMLGLV